MEGSGNRQPAWRELGQAEVGGQWAVGTSGVEMPQRQPVLTHTHTGSILPGLVRSQKRASENTES